MSALYVHNMYIVMKVHSLEWYMYVSLNKQNKIIMHCN